MLENTIELYSELIQIFSCRDKKCFYLLLLLMTALLLHPSLLMAKKSLPGTKERWLKINAPNCTLYSQKDTKNSRQILEYFDYLRQSLFIMAGRRAADAPMPTHIFLFKNRKSYETFKPKNLAKSEGKQGTWLQRPDGNYLMLNGSERSFSDIGKRYVNYLLQTHFVNVPVWFANGFTAYLSTFKVNDKEVTIGLPLSDYLSELRYDDGLPYDQLLRLSPDSMANLDKKHAKIWPAQSWLLMHYLFHGKEGSMRLQMGPFLKSLADGASSSEALPSVFGLEIRTLPSELEDYARQRQHGFLTMAIGELTELTEIHRAPLSEERVRYHLGDLLAHQGKARYEEAEAYFKSALALHSESASSYGGLGFLSAQQGKINEALDFFNKAIALNVKDARTYYRFGAFLLDTTGRDRSSSGIERILQARGYLQRAIDLDDGFSESYVLYGRTFLHDLNGSLHSGITALETALRRMPGREDLAIDLLCLYVLNSDTLRANYYLDEVIGRRWGQSVLAQAKERMVQVQLKRAQEWLQEGKNDKVIGMLSHARRFADIDSQQVQELLDLAKEKRQSELYRLAAARARSGDDATAVEYLNEAMALDADSGVTASSRALFARVGKRLQLDLYSDAMMKMNDNKLKEAERLLLRAIELDANPQITSRARRLLKTVRAAM